MELTHYGRIIRRSWALIVALAVVGAVAGGAIRLAGPHTYTATAEAFVSTGSASNVDDLNASAALTQQVVKSYVEVAPSPFVLRPVIARLGLPTGADALAAHVTATAPLDTAVITVRVSYPSAADATRIADGIVEQLRAAARSLSPNPRSPGATIRITPIRSAITPRAADGPSALDAAAIGLLAGLLLGLVIGFVRDRVDTRVRSPRELALALDRPLLGATTSLRRMRPGSLPAVRDVTSTYARGVRSLATNLEFLDLPAGRRGIVLTSAAHGEGTTTTAVALAVLLAEAGRRVLLIDADLRRPRIATYTRLADGPGLADVLAGRVDRAAATQRWGDRQLDVLVAGRGTTGPDELIRSAALDRLLEEGAAEYDLVLIDAPPLLTASDAAVLARRSAGAVLVAAVGRARHPQVVEALAALTAVGATCLGAAATMVPARRGGTGDRPRPKATRRPRARASAVTPPVSDAATS